MHVQQKFFWKSTKKRRKTVKKYF